MKAIMLNTIMLYPDNNSEKAISGYSNTLTKKIGCDSLTYTAEKPWSLFRMLKTIKQYDVVHVQHEYNLLGWYGLPFFLLYFYLALSKVKVVTTMHTVLSQSEPFTSGRVKTLLRKALYRWQNRIIRYFSHKTVVHANFFKKILISDYGFKYHNIQIFPQAIIEDVPFMSKEDAKKKFNLEGPVYLIIGGFVPDHGADIIIKQAKDIGKTILVVANPSPVNDRNQKRTSDFLTDNMDYVKNEKLNEYVRFDISDISDKKPEWWEYFHAADLVLCPYRGGIGSGIFAHAMATRTPVIGSNIQFFKELSENFKCIQISKNEKDYPKVIEKAMLNSAEMHKECEKYVQQYNVSKVSQGYIKLFSTLAKEQ